MDQPMGLVQVDAVRPQPAKAALTARITQ